MEQIGSIFTVVAVIISGLLLCVSGLSLFFTRRFWLQSNRPIVTATVEEFSSGVGVANLNLVVYNSGNRPATKIRISADNDEIEKVLDDNITDDKKAFVKGIFSEKSVIPLLLNGKHVETAFGTFSLDARNPRDLKLGAAIPITIQYLDIEGREYCSKLDLIIKDSKGFGGGEWT